MWAIIPKQEHVMSKFKIGDKVKNPSGDEFWIISEPKISAHGKAKYNLSSTESIASGADRGRF